MLPKNLNKNFLINIFLVLFLLVALVNTSVGQRNKLVLQREKQKNLAKIKETEKIISETTEQKNASLGELTAVNQRIRQQESLITSISNEINLLNLDIQENNDIITALEVDLSKLKEEYTAMLLTAQKVSGKADKLMFLFSANSFDQFLMRLKYMEQYSNARKEQGKAIGKVQATLAVQIDQTEKIKAEKNKLLSDEENEKGQLTSLKKKQKSVVKNLEKEEKRLRRELENIKKDVAKLDKLISDIIKEELERAAREARERLAKSKKEKTKEVVPKDDDLKLSASFEENKAKFPWPTNGFISQKFGTHDHPLLKGIIQQNDGINIQTKQNEKVRAIFDGEISRIAFFPWLGNSIIIRHGDYFTVYTGLKEVYAVKGQQIKTNQEIGTVFVNPDGVSELRFQIRKNIDALDPQPWLKESD
jgi:murein hydrolase activator